MNELQVRSPCLCFVHLNILRIFRSVQTTPLFTRLTSNINGSARAVQSESAYCEINELAAAVNCTIFLYSAIRVVARVSCIN